MTHILSVIHAENTRLILFWDLMRVAKRFCPQPRGQTKAFALDLRVLETFHDDQVRLLLATEMKEEDITEDDLWFDLNWYDFMRRVQDWQSQRGLENALLKVIEQGFARQRYIRRDDQGFPIRDEQGALIIYDTYQEARSALQKRESVVHQILFLAEKVNTAIREEYGLPTPPKQKKGGAQRTKARNPESTERPSQEDAQMTGREGTQPEESSLQNITHPSHLCEGGTHTCVPGESAADTPSISIAETTSTNAQGGLHENTNGPQVCEEGVRTDADNSNNKIINNPQQILLNESITGAQGASFNPLFDFDFSRKYDQAAILELFKRLLPPLKDRYKTEEERQAREHDWREAACVLAKDAFFRQLGLRYLARTIAYMSLPDSTCKWLAYIRADNPGVVVRPWNLTKRDKRNRIAAQRCAWEMEESNWWPTFLPDLSTISSAEEAPQQIDLAELACVPLEERGGMEREEALEWEIYLRDLLAPYGYEVQKAGIGHRFSGRGYALDVWYDVGRSLRFYSPEQWDLILQVDEVAGLGTPEFIDTLTAALRAARVA